MEIILVMLVSFSLYGFIKYIIPWLIEKPHNEIGWFTKIAAWGMLIGLSWEIFKIIS